MTTKDQVPNQQQERRARKNSCEPSCIASQGGHPHPEGETTEAVSKLFPQPQIYDFYLLLYYILPKAFLYL